MKKIIIVLSGFFVLFLAAIVVIPMVVDVDQYRPKILEKANAKLNGKLELGRLELSLWGTIRVKIEGLDLSGPKGEKVIAVKDAFVTLPWMSIFTGSPVLTFNMRDPEVLVLKDAQGKINVLNLMKEESSTDSGSTGEASEGSADLPSFVTNARLGMDIRKALFSYKDEAAKSETSLRDLNLKVHDLSLSRPADIELSGLFSSQAEDLFKVSGPFKVSMHSVPSVERGEFQGVSGDVKGDFSGIEIRAADLFHKRKGDTATVSGSLSVTKDVLSFSKLEAKFFNAEVSAEGRVTDLQGDPKVDFSLKSNPIALAPWNALVPMLKEYSLSGTADFSARANGPAAKLQYTADLNVKDLKAKSPMLKAEPVMNVTVKAVTDKIEVFTATMKAPRNELSIDGSLVSFEKPKVDLRIRSPGMDLDELLVLPEEPAKGAGAAGGGSNTKTAASEDYDAMLEPLRSNEIARATIAAATVDIKSIKFMDVALTEIIAKLSLRNLVMSIDSATAKLWDGAIGVKGSSAMALKVPTYRFEGSVSGLDLQRAVTSKMALFKDTVLGRVEMKIAGNGSSYNPDRAMQALSAKGSFKITNAVFQSIDVSKMVTEAVNKALEKVGDKIPGAKGKSIKPLPEGTSRYEFMASDFSIASGRFFLPNFNAKAMPKSGLDIRGSTEIGLLDEELKADWEIIDTHDMTKATQVGFEVAGVRIDNALAERGKPVTIPISIGCKYTAPCPSYGKVPEHFVKVATGNAKKGATAAVKEKAKEEVQEKAKDAGKKLLKGIFR
jgi:hypothetical protein